MFTRLQREGRGNTLNKPGTVLTECPRCHVPRPLAASTLKKYRGVIPQCIQCNGRDTTAKRQAERKAQKPNGYRNQWGWWQKEERDAETPS